ncbi:hypothetical protein BP5796_04540 [Coleophoma crateriformis]|uniref:Heterokaryon incompatibility domain-containing protein n=1 Tax=Coleophoma crateriformis TaxID=565419 RepID=A0A3D8S9L1_9HELO|nr:hypothetical protein BP5796_04540 [Coleophoma crateriformis]
MRISTPGKFIDVEALPMLPCCVEWVDSAKMSNRRLPPQRFYTAVHVLLLHWDTRSDELQQKEEGAQNVKDEFYAQLIRLRDTLHPASKYNYNVEVYSLKAQASYRCLTMKLLEFLEKDKDGVLLVIYYGGHAKIDTDRNLIWLRHDPARQSDARNPKLKWSSLQQLLLSGCKSHVLLLLDCCNAAASIEDASSASVVEVTTSTGFENLAPLQSTNSFTAHLVLTLEDLLVRQTPVPASVLCKKVTARLKARWLGRDANERRVTPHHFALHDDVKSGKVVIARLEPSDESEVLAHELGASLTLDRVDDVQSTETELLPGIQRPQTPRDFSYTETLFLSPNSEENAAARIGSPFQPEIVLHSVPTRSTETDRLALQSGIEVRKDTVYASSSRSQSRPTSPASSIPSSQDPRLSPRRRSPKRSRRAIERPGLIAPSDFMTVPNTSMDKQGTYTYTPLKRNNEIRLLHILQGKANETIRCAFSIQCFVESEQMTQDFHALSHLWGSGYQDHEIQIVENLHEYSVTGVFYSFYVKPALHAALLRLRSEKKQVVLWVDAICINQEDHEEVKSQVVLMPWIFRESCHVCVWLGDDADGSDQLQDFVMKILDLTQVDQLIKTDSDASQWKAFADLMLRSWFSRRWIIQEIIQAQTATLYCGSSFALGWLDFCDAVGVFASRFDEIREIFRRSSKFNYNPDALVDIRGLSAYTLVLTTQNLFRHSFDGGISTSAATLETLVSYLPAQEFADPRDAIYSLLALSSDASPNQPLAENGPTSEPLSIRLDYSKTPFEVFRQFVDFCVRRSKSLDILCRHWAPEVIEIPGRLGNGSRGSLRSPLSRPSWTPSVSGLPFGKRGKHRYGRNNGDSLVGTPDKKWYNASKGTIGMAIFGQLEPHLLSQTEEWHPFTEVYDGSMIVSGFQLDTIISLGPRAPGGAILSEWVGMAGWEEEDPTVPDFFWRSLVADRGPYGTPPPTWYHRACLYCLEQSGGNDVEMSRFTGDRCPSIVVEFLERVRNVIWNRMFFRTSSEEEGGLYGLAPSNSRVGDAVCILNGCSVPVILRQHHDFNDTWELIGECFVYGMMDGEAMTDEKSRNTQEFELI